jgi:LuxR family transcriptional regulator, maltose regulon positive regulatory protein
MAQSAKYNKKALCFPDRLKDKLADMIEYPFTIASAPMGYGKTTAVREYLNEKIDKEEPFTVLWQNVLDASPACFWEDFAGEFALLGAGFSETILTMGMISDSAQQRTFFKLFSEFCKSIKQDIVFVIDCGSLATAEEVNQFLRFFIRILPEQFHLVLLSRYLTFQMDGELSLYGNVNYILQKDFEFSPVDIGKYFKLCGLNLSKENSLKLHSITEGWISLIHMNLLAYIESGSFLTEQEIIQSIERIIYEPLPKRYKEFLSWLCMENAFTVSQAEYLWSGGDAEAILTDLSYKNWFIFFSSNTGGYQFHNILFSCLKNQYQKLPQQEQNERLDRAANWYLKIGENSLARRFFYREKNFEALIDAVEKRRFLNSYALDDKFFMSYYTDCPPEIRARRPKAILVFARHLFALNNNELAEKVCREFEESMKNSDFLEEEERRRMMGRYKLLLCYAQYNDLEAMTGYLKKAQELLDGHPTSIIWPDTGLNDSISVLHMYHRRSGELEKELCLFTEFNPLYSKLTGGRSTGAELVMQAEAYYAAGNLEAAEINVQKALFVLHRDTQWNVWLCAIYLQLHIGLMKGDWSYVQYLLQEVREAVSINRQDRLVPVADICMAAVYCKLGQPQMIQPGFDNKLNESLAVCVRTVSMMHSVYAGLLLAKKEYVTLIALSEEYLKAARVHPNLLSEIVLRIEIAGAYEALGHRKESCGHLKTALDLAVPDKIIMPFVEFGNYISVPLNDIAKTDYALEIKDILSRVRDFRENLKKIINEHFVCDDYGLTTRELEIARLAARRLSNREIADELMIGEHTVKTHLSRVFSKLDIKKRSDLEQYF